ncbi:MAG: hypothetical protein HZA48_10370 [Planctomycetes bacterium]|nr:hypothetical protein [Planctomycetota bacterium]
MEIVKKQVLVTVKAYPNPSNKYDETVCCAGIDLTNNQWVRLYPVPYRDLEESRKFKKYSIIEINCSKTINDKRPESFKIDSDSIEVIRWINTDKKWMERKEIVLQLPQKSMCKIISGVALTDNSLGLIKPKDIKFDYSKKTVTPATNDYNQLTFWNQQKSKLEEIPFNFYYFFHCEGEKECQGHRLSIIDWEIGQAYRKWKEECSTEEELLAKIQQKWLEIADTFNRDVYFYVGNMKRFRNIFMVLGVFYPPK